MSRSRPHAFNWVMFSALIALTAACGKDSSTTPTPPPPPQPTQPPPPPPTPVATRITITPASVTLTAIGRPVQLTAQVFDQNNNVMTGAAVSWQSSNEAVAKVSATGLVTAANNGTARITARSGSISQGVTVMVMLTPASIVIDTDETTLTSIGERLQLAARVLDADRRTIIVGANVAWKSSDETVATVSDSGLVTAVDNGVASITATTGDVSASIEVTVMQSPDSIVIDPEEATLAEIGDTVQLIARVLDRNGHAIEGAGVTWESGDRAIATVDDQGLVTAAASGTVDITARSGDVSSASSVTVKGVVGAVMDREVLTTLYHRTNGDEWINNENWLSDRPLSTWYGVTTNIIGDVLNLKLERNNLQGSIPAELCHLTSLRILLLSHNDLTGEIPPELGLLANLGWLGLGGNELVGGIPSELGQLTLLEGLVLNTNKLTGNIPPELGQLTFLRDMFLVTNKLTGNIPPELGQLANLEILYISENKLTGSIPPELGQLANLKTLSLGNNELTGSIPPELGQLSQLTELSVSSNKLTGVIPLELAQLTALTTLWLSKNDLTGTIPPELAQLTELTVLDFNRNTLTGNIPPELAQLTKLELLYFDRNALTGNIPPELAQLTDLRELWFNHNRFTGTIPPELGMLKNLLSLTFNNNQLTGTIPDELGQLTELGFLWLADNPGLSGPLPDSFSALEHMQYLTLINTGLCVPATSTFRAWIDGIQRSTGVQYCSAP